MAVAAVEEEVGPAGITTAPTHKRERSVTIVTLLFRFRDLKRKHIVLFCFLCVLRFCF